MSKRFACYFLLLCIAFALQGCVRHNGFHLKKIISKHSSDPRWEVDPLSLTEAETLSHVLSQTFSYLASGNQCYVFESKDKKYVLKFFKQNLMKKSFVINYLPKNLKRFNFLTKKSKKRSLTRENSFTSYTIAHTYLKKETGLFYLHLNQNTSLHKTLKLIDPHGQEIQVASDQMEFLIQRKAELVFDYLGNLLNKKQEVDLLKSIESLLKLVIERMQMGISDLDLDLSKNFGFVNNHPIKLDIGEFKIDPAQNDKKIIEGVIQQIEIQIEDWVNKKCPHLMSQLHKIIENVCS